MGPEDTIMVIRLFGHEWVREFEMKCFLHIVRTAHACVQHGLWILIITGLATGLVACGGGCSTCSASTAPEVAGSDNSHAVSEAAPVTLHAMVLASVGSAKPSRQEATRFLTQATFGPSPADVAHLMDVGYEAWLNEQFDTPAASLSHVAAWDISDTATMAAFPGQRASRGAVISSFWREALTGNDQLRQRMAFALSEIFVVSLLDSCGDGAYSRGMADYLDMLDRQAFGNFRQLLESVALHPVMGCYLSHMKNQAEDLGSGRVPDENFAREIMQLFSIGLHELNPDGTPRLDALHQPIETYTAADISGLAKVFTGWSWYCSTGLTPSCFYSNASQRDQYVTPMRAYARYHSTSEKRFLKTVIPSSWLSTPEDDLALALDALSQHANVGPFIGKQLIQRFVTSNPSPVYVGRVASAFRASGGSLKSTIGAVLLDPEARNATSILRNDFGKVREPILRLSALLRSVGARSDSGMYLLADIDGPLGQSPMSSPSVFNFFRPGYVSPGTRSAASGLLAPEMQQANETTVAGYVNFMTAFMWSGAGMAGFDNKAHRLDVQLAATLDASHPLLTLANNPAALVEEINQRLMYGTMPTDLRTDIAAAINTLDFRAQPTPTAEQVTNTQRYRLWSALLLTMASPDFLTQR